MTNEQIIKALECCAGKYPCSDCPYDEEGCEFEEDVLSLITRQKEEIERLTTLAELGKVRANDYREMRDKLKKANAEIERLTAMVEAAEDYMHPLPFKNAFDEEIEKAKSEARKEFAERLKEKKYNTEFVTPVVDVEDIDNLLKEMESEVF